MTLYRIKVLLKFPAAYLDEVWACLVAIFCCECNNTK